MVKALDLNLDSNNGKSGKTDNLLNIVLVSVDSYGRMSNELYGRFRYGVICKICFNDIFLFIIN